MSREAAFLVARCKAFARSLRVLARLAPEIVQTNTNTGVAAEVAALSLSSVIPGDGTDTDTTREEYENFILTVTEFNKFYNSQALSPSAQNNASYTQNMLQGA